MREIISLQTKPAPKLWKVQKADFEKEIKLLNDDAYALRGKAPEESFEKANQALFIAVENELPILALDSKLNIGFYHMYKGTYRLAMETFMDVLYGAEDLRDDNLKAKANYNIGVLYFKMLEFEDALEFLTQAREYYLKENIESRIAKCQFQFASLAFAKTDYSTALDLAEHALSLEKRNQDENSIAALQTLIGRIYIRLDDAKLAEKAFKESLRLREKSGDNIGLASCIYYQIELLVEQKKWKQARQKIEENTQNFADIEFPFGECLFQKIQAKVATHFEEWDEAIELHESAIKIANDNGLKEMALECYAEITRIFEAQEMFSEALKYHKWYLTCKEEANNHSWKIKIDNLKLQREVADRQKLDHLSNTKDVQLEKAQETIAKMHLELQSSFVYSKRIQDAVMPTEELVKELFPQSYVMNRPMDIVTGDFLWIHEVDGLKYAAVADCTGHGVAGSILSVYATNALNTAVGSKGLRSPAEILDDVRKSFIDNFMSDKLTIKDGMDIALVRIKDNELTFSGAYRSLGILRNGTLSELKGDRQPIGLFLNTQSFKDQEFALHPGDQLYMYTDGLTDQVGGLKKKKLKYQGLQQWLTEDRHKSMEEQMESLDIRFNTWMSTLEQVDDVFIFSFKIDGEP